MHIVRKPKLADTMTAAQKVLNIPELVEPILLHLPMLDVVVCQRVAPKWRDIISASPQLQIKLWLRAREPQDARQGSMPDKVSSTAQLTSLSSEEAGPILEWNTAVGLFRQHHPQSPTSPQVVIEARLQQLCETEGRWDRMLVRQPLTKQILLACIYTKASDDGKLGDAVKCRKIINESGVTLKDIWQVCKQNNLIGPAQGMEATKEITLFYLKWLDNPTR